MGLCNSKESDQFDPPGQGSKGEKQSLVKNGRAQNYMSGLVPSTLEDRNRTEPEQEQPTIKNEETQKIDETARYVVEHPVYQQHGIDVYKLHIVLEDVYGMTYYPLSLERNPSLKLGVSQTDQNVFTLDASEDQIQKLLIHQHSNNSYETKLHYLYEVYVRLQAANKPSVLNRDQKAVVKKTLFSHMAILPSPAEHWKIMGCNSDDILRFSSHDHQALYTKFASLNKDFIADFFAYVETEDLDEVLTPIFKIIIRDCNKSTIHDIKKLHDGIEILDAILQSNNRVIDCFVKHELYIPKNRYRIDGDYFEKYSMFGAFLTLRTFTDDVEQKNPIVQINSLNIFFDASPTIDALRAPIHKAVFGVHQIMEHMIKADQKYGRDISDWCYQALLLNEDKRKMLDPNSDPNITTKVASQGWFTNYLLLLLRMCENFLGNVNEYPKLCTRIQTQFFQERQIFKDCVLLNGKDNKPPGEPNEENKTEEQKEEQKYEEVKSEEADRLRENNKGSNPQDDFLTQVVFFAGHALISHCYTNRKYRHIVDRVTEMINSSNFFQLAFVNPIKAAHDVQLGDPYLHEQMYKLFTFQVLTILHSCDIPVQDLNNIDKAFEKTASLKRTDLETKGLLPLYWVEMIYEYMVCIRKAEESIILTSLKESEILLSFALSLIRNPDWISASILKVLDFLGMIVPRKLPMMHGMDDQKENDTFIALLMKNRFFKNYLVEGIVNVFIAIQKIIPTNLLWERVKYRIACCQMLSHLLGSNSALSKTIPAAETFDRLAKQTDDPYAKLIVHYLDDILLMLDYGLLQLKEVKAYLDNSANELRSDREELKQKYENNKSELNGSCISLKVYYETAINLTKVTPNFFLSATVKEKFIANLNESLKNLNTVEVSDYVSQDITVSHPRFLMAILFQIYMNFAEKREFIKSIVEDEGNFDIEYFHSTLAMLKKHKMLGFLQKRSLKAFLTQLEKESQENAKNNQIMRRISSAVPEEFRDPITGEIMKDPVLVPTSKLVMERTVILRHLLSSGTDPYTRLELTKEMLVPQSELKKRIENFLSSEKAKFMPAPKKKFGAF